MVRAGRTGALIASAPTLAATAAACGSSAASRSTHLRVGLDFGPSTSMDPQARANGYLDEVRQRNVFDTLFDFDNATNVVPRLAQSLEPRPGALEWTLRIKSGVEFHDGSPCTSADVIYSLKRILISRPALEGFASLSNIIPTSLKALDAHTVSLSLYEPDVSLAAALAQRTNSIIKDGATSFRTLNGTGPFRHLGEDANDLYLAANAHYHISGRPRSSRVHCINMVDEQTRFNALLANSVDVAPMDTLALLPQIQSFSGLKAVLSDRTGEWSALVMNTTRSPFNDVRVRQAMRLLADREQLIGAAQRGYGVTGNDLFGRLDPLYADSIRQRTPDPANARSLLKSAGHEDTTFVLNSSSAVGPNAVSSALVFAQQAASARIKVTVVQQPPSLYFTKIYGAVPFEQATYAFRPLMLMWRLTLDPSGTFFKSDTAYDDPRATYLFREASKTLDTDRRKQLMLEAQQIEWDSGGYLLWGYSAWLDAIRGGVTGVVPSPVGQLSNWALWNIHVG
jgi:peptide/nickel transport system substrate-binding protein